MTDFTMFAGDSKVLVVTIVDDDGAAVNITGAAIKWQAARTVSDSSALISKTTDSPGGVAITDGADGEFEVTLDEADTDDLDGLYYHEAEITMSGDTSTVLTGYMVVEQTLIRAP